MASAYRLKPIKEPIKKPSGMGTNLLGTKFDLDKIRDLFDKLNSILIYYKKYAHSFNIFPVKFSFNKLLAKSHRFTKIIENASGKQIDSVYKFHENGELKDEIELTYQLNFKEIEKIKSNLLILIKFVNKLSDEDIRQYNEIPNGKEEAKLKTNFFKKTEIKLVISSIGKVMTCLKEILHDIAYLESIEVPTFIVPEKAGYASLYNSISYNDIIKILQKIELKNFKEKIINLSDEYFLDLDKEDLDKINMLFPFAIRTAGKNRIEFNDDDLNKITKNKEKRIDQLDFDSQPLRSEIIGVIDTWASEDLNKISKDIIEIDNRELEQNLIGDYSHGTQVVTLASCSSLFQDNNLLNDHLGIFKVKHFGILGGKGSYMTFTSYLRKIYTIIKDNHKKIKIWNLSIDIKEGGENKNDRKLISELGRMFDKIQVEFDVIFIVSTGNSKIISPGSDSLMAISTGACYLDNKENIMKSSYTGSDHIFSRLEKPDVYDFGNDIDKEINPTNTLNLVDESLYLDRNTNEEGTSFSTPLMARKCAYLKEKYNLSIESLRAMINLLAELSSQDGKLKLVNPFLIENASSDYVFCWLDGEINPKDYFSEKIWLPTKNKDGTMYRDFHPMISISHQIYPEQRWGDEYVGTEIEFKITGKNYKNEKSLPILRQIRANNENEKTEFQRITKWGKYNPNIVLTDGDFQYNGDNYKTPFYLANNSLKMSIRCIDMFSSIKSYKYGVCFVLKGMNKDSLKNFEVENQDIIEKIYSSINVEIKEKIKEENTNLN